MSVGLVGLVCLVGSVFKIQGPAELLAGLVCLVVWFSVKVYIFGAFFFIKFQCLDNFFDEIEVWWLTFSGKGVHGRF